MLKQYLLINLFILKGLDLFSGAGGMSLGAISSGIDIIFAIDNDLDAKKTYIKNHPTTKFINEDICKLDPKDYITEEIFIIFGGPPCQGFSTSNTKTRNIKNQNNYLFNEFVRFVKEINPKWFIFENVEGITKFNKGKTVIEIENSFKKLGYLTNKKVLSAADYGVPQYRNRFFLVGNRLGVEFEFPQKESTKITVEEAISDLPRLQNGDKFDKLNYIKDIDLSDYAIKMRKDSEFSTQNYVSRNQDYVINRYKYIKQGENWHSIPKELMNNYKDTNNCHSGIYKRLDNKKPSIVISNYRKNMLIHPYENRGLSVREASRLQSFPDMFVFEGSLNSIQQQIGNAVPPLLAKALFQQILHY